MSNSITVGVLLYVLFILGFSIIVEWLGSSRHTRESLTNTDIDDLLDRIKIEVKEDFVNRMYDKTQRNPSYLSPKSTTEDDIVRISKGKLLDFTPSYETKEEKTNFKELSKRHGRMKPVERKEYLVDNTYLFDTSEYDNGVNGIGTFEHDFVLYNIPKSR